MADNPLSAPLLACHQDARDSREVYVDTADAAEQLYLAGLPIREVIRVFPGRDYVAVTHYLGVKPWRTFVPLTATVAELVQAFYAHEYTPPPPPVTPTLPDLDLDFSL